MASDTATADLSQLDDLVVTINGYTTQNLVSGRNKYQVINFRYRGDRNYAKHINASGITVLRDNMKLTTNELEVRECRPRGVVVGMILYPSTVNFDIIAGGKRNKGQSFGQKRPPDDQILVSEQTPQYVVCELHPGGMLKQPYRVLLSIRSGLTTGYMCRENHVFFFSEFRSSNASTDGRRDETRDRINGFIKSRFPSEAAAEVRRITESPHEIDENAKSSVKLTEPILKAFVESQQPFCIEQATEFVEVFEKRWPKSGVVLGAGHICNLHYQVVDKKLRIKDHELQPFILKATVAQGENETGSLNGAVETILEKLRDSYQEQDGSPVSGNMQSMLDDQGEFTHEGAEA